MKTTTTTVAELERLSGLLRKYAHRWGEYPSNRMQNWIEQYGDLKRNDKAGWSDYCAKRGLDPTHDGYDCLC